MSWSYGEFAKAAATREIDRLLQDGARYVLTRSGPGFMAIKNDGSFIDSIAMADSFMGDVEPALRAKALDELAAKAKVQPQHLVIILGIS